MEERIVTYVSGDITFIMRETWQDGKHIRDEVTGFYWGMPNEADTERFKNKPYAEYDY